MHTPRQALTRLSALAVVLVLLVGCGSGSPDPQARDTSEPTASSTPTGNPDAPDEPISTPTPRATPDSEAGQVDYCKNQEPFTDAAADGFGADAVADAYCTMVTLQMEEAFRDDLLRGDSGTLTPADFAVWTRYMPAETADRFNASLQKALRKDAGTDAKFDVWSLTFFDALSGSPFEFTDEPAVFDRTYSTAETGYDAVDGGNRLLLDIKFTANLNVTRDDIAYLVPIGREIRFALTKNPNPTSDDDDWLIDSWNGEFTVGDPVERPDDYVGDPAARSTA